MVFDLRATGHAWFRFFLVIVLVVLPVASARAFSTSRSQLGEDLAKSEVLSVPSPSPAVTEVNSEGRSAMPTMPAVCVALIVLGVYTLREAYRRSRFMCFALIVFVEIAACGMA